MSASQTSRTSNDIKLKERYKLYCKTLSASLKYKKSNMINNFKNKMKTTGNTNKSETGKKVSRRSVHLLNISGDLTNN